MSFTPRDYATASENCAAHVERLRGFESKNPFAPDVRGGRKHEEAIKDFKDWCYANGEVIFAALKECASGRRERMEAEIGDVLKKAAELDQAINRLHASTT